MTRLFVIRHILFKLLIAFFDRMFCIKCFLLFMTGFKTIKARQVDEFSSQDETAITLTKFSCNCEHQEN